jgi:hypothetical protein
VYSVSALQLTVPPTFLHPSLNVAPVLIDCSDQLAQLTHMMTCIDQDNWMTDVLHFKMSMFTRQLERASSPSPPLKYYAAVV